MSGSENSARAGRFTALATLSASAVLFASALFGIASIDPSADAASPVGGPSLHEVSLDEKRGPAHDRRDCPFKQRNPSHDDGVQS